MSSRSLSAPITDAERPRLMAIGRRLKAAREGAGWTRAELADATGLNRKTLWRIEVGTRRTRARTLAAIANVISDSPEKLVSEFTELRGSALARVPLRRPHRNATPSAGAASREARSARCVRCGARSPGG